MDYKVWANRALRRSVCRNDLYYIVLDIIAESYQIYNEYDNLIFEYEKQEEGIETAFFLGKSWYRNLGDSYIKVANVEESYDTIDIDKEEFDEKLVEFVESIKM